MHVTHHMKYKKKVCGYTASVYPEISHFSSQQLEFDMSA